MGIFLFMDVVKFAQDYYNVSIDIGAEVPPDLPIIPVGSTGMPLFAISYDSRACRSSRQNAHT